MSSAAMEEDVGQAWQPREQLRQTLAEIQCMWAHATSRGIAVPSATVHALDELITKVGASGADGLPPVPAGATDEELAERTDKALEVHALFSALVAPAHPSSLSFNRPVHGLKAWLHQYPAVTIIAFFGLIGIALFATFATGLAQIGTGQIFGARPELACAGAAMLGSAFFSTFEASKYIVAQTYDSRYAGTYVIRFLLGITAGLILANFGNALLKPSSETGKLGVATFALVGGYSADAVNSLLMRVSDTLTAAVKGRADAEVATKGQQLQAAQIVADVHERRAIAAKKELEEMRQSAPTAPPPPSLH